MKKKLIITIFCFLNLISQAQEPGQQFTSYIENIIEQVVSDNDEETDTETILADLEHFFHHKLNINSAERNDLEKLWVLNDFQIHSLLEYRRSMYRIASVHELRYVFGFNNRLVDLVSPFIYCGPVERKERQSVKEIVKRSRHEILMRTSLKNPSETNYMGSSLQQYVRYKGNFSNTFKVGLIGEKDAGEEFGKGTNNSGFDFYSGHLQFSSKSVLKNLILGDYRVRLGQGLLIWNGYAPGKSGELSALQKRGQGLSPNSSKDEYNFLRGGAITLAKKGITFSAWGSLENKDGVIDSLAGEPVVRSINTSGYHRTKTETERKNNTEELCYGASVSWRSLNYALSFNWLHSEYSLPIVPEDKIYKKKDFSGSSYDGFSADYKFLFQKIQLFGEVAYANKAFAGITGLNMMPSSQLTTTLFYRNYQPEYYTPYPGGIAESGGNNNEEALFGGINWHTDWNVRVSAYADVFTFPWLSFSSDAPTSGVDYFVEAAYSPSREFEFYLRYKNKQKGKNYSSEELKTGKVEMFRRQNIRAHARYKISRKLSMASRFEISESGYIDQERFNGYLLYQDLKYKPFNETSIYFRYARFHIEDYDSRIYAYENDVLYAYSIPAYYENGQKTYIMLRQKILRNIILWGRYACTTYSVSGKSEKHEFRGQLLVKF